MSDTFRIGEIAIITHSYLSQFPVGMEVPILAEERCHSFTCSRCRGTGELAYLIGMIEGFRIIAHPNCLRKKPPPDDHRKVVEWSDLPWQPTDLTEKA